MAQIESKEITGTVESSNDLLQEDGVKGPKDPALKSDLDMWCLPSGLWSPHQWYGGWAPSCTRVSFLLLIYSGHFVPFLFCFGREVVKRDNMESLIFMVLM